MLRPTELAHEIVRRRLRPGDVVVDGTLGNGHDTLFLLEQVGAEGKVFAIDRQPKAIHSAMKLLAAQNPDAMSQVEFIQADHGSLAEFIPPEYVGKLGAVMFNLGYLPGGDQTFTTQPETTLRALRIAAKWLRSGGVLSVVAYVGHPGGEEEATAVEDFFTGLGKGWNCWGYSNLSRESAAPRLLTAVKV
jgi:predicted methyltransferase